MLQRRKCLAALLLGLLVASVPVNAQLEGLWEGYDGEWDHVSRQLVALAQAIPADKFAWRPAAGVRSTSEVLMHIAIANYGLLSVTGPPMPVELNSPTAERTITSKPEIIAWLSRSQAAVKKNRAVLSSSDFQRKVKISGKEVTVDGIYLRVIVHANEHMGQLVAYSRVNGIAPPWSEGAKK